MAAATPPVTSTLASRHRHVVDALLVVLLCIPTIARARPGDVPLVVAVCALTALLVVARRRWPVASLAFGLVLALACTALFERPTGVLPLTVLLTYEIAVRFDRRRGLWAGGVTLLGMLGCVAILVSNNFVGPELLAGLAWPAFAVAAGEAIRSRREAIAAAEERAQRAELSREDEARRRVVEERMRIARELHDVIAHRMAVVNVQAGVAGHLLRSEPDQAEAALTEVRSSTRAALDELSAIVGVLRSDDEPVAPVQPTPSLRDLPALVDSFSAAGLIVHWITAGAEQHTTDSVSLAIYRTVQEALTNAHKHGTGTAELTIAHCPGEVAITVRNPMGATTHSESGFGLLGMRERVLAAGGTVTCGTADDGHFCVDVWLPVGVSR